MAARRRRSAAHTTGTRPGAASTRTPLGVIAAIAVVIIGVGAWAYSTSFAGVFVWDDMEAVVSNTHIKTLWPLSQSATAPPGAALRSRPVASLTFALNYALAPPDARDVMLPASGRAPDPDRDPFYRNIWGYHALNLAIHCGAALLLFGVVRRSLLTGPLRETFGPAAPWLAGTIALVWVVHPLTTEAVTYIVQRTESLAALFMLLAFYSAIRATEPPADGWGWPAAAIVACALGTGAKEVAAVTPVLVALWLWLLRPIDPAHRRRTLILLGGLGAAWIVLAAIVLSGARAEVIGFARGGWTWWSYFETQMLIVTRYFRLAFVPAPLVAVYDWRPVTSVAAVAAPAALLLTLGAATTVALWRRRPVGFLGAWVFIILAPTSSILVIATEAAAERRMYLPLAAVIALVVLGAYHLGRRAIESRAGRQVALGAAAVAVVAATCACAMLTHERNKDYWSDEALMRQSAEQWPSSQEAHLRYGADLFARQQFAESARALTTALGMPFLPGSGSEKAAIAHMYLGASLCALGQLDNGVPHLEQAIALRDTMGEPYGFLAEAHLTQGKTAEAMADSDRAVARLPTVPPLLNREAWLLATLPDDRLRDGVKAVALAETAVRLGDAGDPALLETLAAAYAEGGRFQDAIAAAERAFSAAQRQGDQAFSAELQADLTLFRAGRKIRRPAR